MSAALEIILNRQGQLRIDALARIIGMSRRQMERRFTHTFGLTPKRLCRIARFSSVFGLFSSQPVPNWADIAFSRGYSDQAHFIREWKFFTGQSPLAYLKHLTPLESAIMGF